MLTSILAATLAATMATAPPIEPNPAEPAQTDVASVWSASALYDLSTGDTAEIYLEIESDVAEVAVIINGDIIARATADESGTTSWAPTDTEYPPEVIVEALEGAAADDVLRQLIPEAFPCSKVGKQAAKLAKYATATVLVVSTAFCCGNPTTALACGACTAASTLGGLALGDAFDNYCD